MQKWQLSAGVWVSHYRNGSPVERHAAGLGCFKVAWKVRFDDKLCDEQFVGEEVPGGCYIFIPWRIIRGLICWGRGFGCELCTSYHRLQPFSVIMAILYFLLPFLAVKWVYKGCKKNPIWSSCDEFGERDEFEVLFMWISHFVLERWTVLCILPFLTF